MTTNDTAADQGAASTETPSKYIPDDLGTAKVRRGRCDQRNLRVPVAAVRALGADIGDHVRFVEGDDGSVRMQIVERAADENKNESEPADEEEPSADELTPATLWSSEGV